MTSAPPELSSLAAKPSGPAARVIGRCKTCGSTVTGFNNAWIQVTRTYFLEAQEYINAIALQKKGEPITPSSNQQALKDCLLQPLTCSCGETVAFNCVKAPANGTSFIGRNFYKLSRIKLCEANGNMQVKPLVLSSIEQLPSTEKAQTTPKSPVPSQAPLLMTDADRSAVEGTNNGALDWQEAHENWTDSTRETLSPMSFAKRILDFGGGNLLKKAPIIEERLPAVKAVPAKRAAIPAPKPVSVPSGAAKSANMASSTTKSKPQSRLSEQGVRPNYQFMQKTPQAPQQPTAGQRPVAHQGSLHQKHSQMPSTGLTGDLGGPGGGYPPDILDRFAKDIASLQSSVNTLQATSSDIVSLFLALRTEVREASCGPIYGRYDELELLSNSVSDVMTKVGKLDGMVVRMDSFQRKLNRLERVMPNYDGTPSFHDAPVRLVHDRTRSPAVTDLRIKMTAHGPKRVGAPADEPMSKRQRSGSDAGAFVVNGPQTPGPRKVGRPRKSEGLDWERKAFGMQEDAEGYMRPVSLSSDRGRIVRRGSPGGPFSVRTRRKPTRDEHGNLLRSDGSIDRRSTTSARNLKKALEKKNQMSDAASPPGSSSAPNGMSPANTQVNAQVNTQGNTQGNAQVNPQEAAKPAPKAASPEAHRATMSRMFPHGVDEDTRRVDHASRLFAPYSPEKAKMLPRQEMERTTEVVTDPSSRDVGRDGPPSSYVPSPLEATKEVVQVVSTPTTEKPSISTAPGGTNGTSTDTQQYMQHHQKRLQQQGQKAVGDSQDSYRPTNSEVQSQG